MQKILLIIACCCWYLQANAQTNIVQAEYYIDNDPGFGNAAGIPISASVNVADNTFPVSLTALQPGLHALFIRSKNGNGNWSLTNALFFYKPTAITAAGNITKAEYYFDNDPGFGFATDIPVTASPNIQDASFSASINSLPVGIHILFIRSQDANGKWSVTNQLVYYKKYPLTVIPNITKAEYYFDNDPGFGFATAIALTSGADLQNVNFSAGIQSLTAGLHILFLRSCNAQGKWSITNQLVFYKPPTAPGGVLAIEYFYDSEPGFGNGVPVAINEVTDLSDYIIPMNITGLTVGDHKLFMRSKSSNGWSVTNMYPFNISTTSPTPFININSITSKTNCAWADFRISFHATGNYLPNNIFTVQLSNAGGSFTSPINIGQITSQTSSEVRCALPEHLADGANYRIRVISSNTAVTGAPSYDSVTLHDRPELGNDTTVFIVCANETLNLLPLYNTNGLLTNWNIVTPMQAPTGTYQLIVTNTYGCRDSAIAIVKQDVSFWRGTISSNWHVAGNWSTGRVPSEKTHVIIPSIVTNPCEITDTDAVVASMQVRTGGVLNVRNNRKLLVIATCNPLPAGL